MLIDRFASSSLLEKARKLRIEAAHNQHMAGFMAFHAVDHDDDDARYDLAAKARTLLAQAERLEWKFFRFACVPLGRPTS